MQYLPGARGVAGFLLLGLLAGCGGGGGGDDSAPVQISTPTMAFTAASPSAATPAAQTFTVSFGKDVVQLAVVHSGDAIASTSSVQSGRSATITVTPAAPSGIGAGLFQGAVAVTGYTCADTTCSRLAAGSSATVLVNYQISPAIYSVSPYVATSGVSDTVIVRGIGFRAFTGLSVRFNDTPGTDLAISTDGTQLSVVHPALTAGDYTVHLDATNHTGAIPSTVVLRVVDPVAYAATTLDYPASTTAVRSLFYDAERQALFAVTDTSPSNPILRYQYSGGTWAAPTQAANGFLDAALSADGTQLFAITGTTVVPVDPVTLALGTAITAPSLATNSALKNIVVGFDNRALITTSLTTSGTTAPYLYDPPTAAVVAQTSYALNNGTPAMAANGTNAVVSQGDPTLTADVVVYAYTSATNSLTATTESLRQNTIPPAISRAANRVALNGLRIYDGSFAFLGTVPNTTAALVFKPDGTRLYAYDTASGGILVYDTSVDKDEAAYTPVGAVTPLPADPGSSPRITISPDGGTLFLAGSTRIVVMPTPAG